jgi:hypothetical protein
MAFPTQVLKLSVLHTPSPALTLMTRCFGAQASMCGLLLLTTNMNKRAYKYFGLAMIPFFVFDGYFWWIGRLTHFGGIGDALGNVVFAFCCYKGYMQYTGKK